MSTALEDCPRTHRASDRDRRRRGRRVEARLRNVSRGGLFVDSPLHLDKAEEVALHFRLEAHEDLLRSTARVVLVPADAGGTRSIGLRFLAIDAKTVARLDHYVSDHFPRLASQPA
ncbi:MAG: PilZ domain-containing protein [Myxococcota bacterium]